jgi:hypothetical protein
VEIRHADHVAPLYPQKLPLTSPTSGGRSVGIVRSRTQGTEFNFFSLIDASKEVGLEINAEKTKYMLLSRHQNVGQNRDINEASVIYGLFHTETFYATVRGF